MQLSYWSWSRFYLLDKTYWIQYFRRDIPSIIITDFFRFLCVYLLNFSFWYFHLFFTFSLQLYHIIKLIYRWLYRLKALNKRLIYPLHFLHHAITLAVFFKQYRRFCTTLQVFKWISVCMLLRKDIDNTSIYFPLLCCASGYLAVVIITEAINCHHHFPSMIYRRQTFLYYEKLCRSL